MRTAWLVVALLLALDPAASSQRLYWGVIGGTGLTPDFPRYDVSGPADAYGNPAYHFEHLPGGRSLIFGGLLEVQLTPTFAIEADVLHRPLQTTIVYAQFPASGPSVTTTNNYVAANTWEFPLMLKWNLPPLATRRVRPFLEGGVAFRTSQDVGGALPSQFGLTVGAGAAVHLGKLWVAPTIRYTRWDKETFFPPYPTKGDQVEFLTSVAWGTGSDPLHANGHRLGLGLLGGTSLLGEFYYPDSGVKERIGYLAGASAQLELRQGLALEIDDIYKPLHAGDFTVLTWDFPVQAKYHVAKFGRAPFVEAGPSFRVAGNFNGYNPSHYGVTVGAGAQTVTRGVRLSTALRYTRWAKDGYPYSLPPGVNHDYERTNVNAVELIFGVGLPQRRPDRRVLQHPQGRERSRPDHSHHATALRRRGLGHA
jgi:hypothetical protein